MRHRADIRVPGLAMVYEIDQFWRCDSGGQIDMTRSIGENRVRRAERDREPVPSPTSWSRTPFPLRRLARADSMQRRNAGSCSSRRGPTLSSLSGDEDIPSSRCLKWRQLEWAVAHSCALRSDRPDAAKDAECELSCLTSPCLSDRRMADIMTLQSEISAWATRTYAKQRDVDWQFTIEKARVKLKRFDPKV
jgi:hypothetical protein